MMRRDAGHRRRRLWRRDRIFRKKRRPRGAARGCALLIDKMTSAAPFRGVSLDALNFLLADVRGALGPYLNVFLVTQQQWSQETVGLVTTVGGLLGLALQTPVGDVFGPAVAALTLGLYPRRALAARMGRNAACDHAGNVVIAMVAGGVGWLAAQRAVFLLVPVFALLAAFAVLSIPAGAINHQRARGADHGQDGGPRLAGLAALFGCRPLLLYAGCTMLFHFANAPLLPLVGQKLAFAHREWATAMMSGCIIAAQMIMLPIAVLVGRHADGWGRKPILLIGFGILPIRAALYTLSNASAWLLSVQLLDGIGAGVWGA